MSSIEFDSGKMSRAEQQFREAFDRLKRGKPQILPKGTKLSQRNVAREAGLKPGALRSERFPILSAEILDWIKEHGDDAGQQSPRQAALAQRSRNRGFRERMTSLKDQRDDALSRLVNAEERIVYLTMENERLRAQLPTSSVARLRPADTSGN